MSFARVTRFLIGSVALLPLSATPSMAATNDEQAQSLMQRGYALMRAGDDGAAIPFLTKAIFARPGNLNARRLLAQAELHIGRADDCAKQIEALAAVEPNVAADQAILGQAYFSLGKTEIAANKFKRALDLDPNNQQALLGLADILIAKGDYIKAGTYCKRVIAVTKNQDTLETAHSKLSVIEQCCQKLSQPQS